MTRRALKLSLILLGLSLPLLATEPARNQAWATSLDGAADTFRLFASELVVDLDRIAATRNPGDTLTIAVWPDPVGRAPVPEALAREYNDRLLAALVDAGGHRHRFVARESLRAVVRDVAESSDQVGSLDLVLAALSERAQADVLVVSKLRSVGTEEIQISYRAVDVEDATILGATSHRRLAVLASEVGAAASAMSLEQALEEATGTLVRRAPSLQVLRLKGLNFADSEQQTPFGRYLEGRLADTLVEAYENPLTGRSILLRHATLVEQDQPLPPASGEFDLQGRYWDFGEVVELRLSLEDQAGVVAVWRGRMKTASLPANLRRQPGSLVARDAKPAARSAPQTPGVGAATVRRSQRNLQVLGFPPGPIDGVLGPRTRIAIGSYQASEGLPVDGRLTPELAARLDKSGARARLARPVPVKTVQTVATPAVVTPATVTPVVTSPVNGSAVGGSYCREYVQSVTIGGKRQATYGTVCRQPDGSWIFAGR